MTSPTTLAADLRHIARVLDPLDVEVLHVEWRAHTGAWSIQLYSAADVAAAAEAFGLSVGSRFGERQGLVEWSGTWADMRVRITGPALAEPVTS